jgi:hypothetical protein
MKIPCISVGKSGEQRFADFGKMGIQQFAASGP